MNKLVSLTEKQRRLVDTLVATGCSITEASQVAGYAKGDAGRVTASKALKTAHVQEYMMQSIASSIGVNATLASSKLVKLASGAKSEYVQLEASKDILDHYVRFAHYVHVLIAGCPTRFAHSSQPQGDRLACLPTRGSLRD